MLHLLTAAEKMAGLTVSSAFVTINGKHIISNNNKGVVAISDSEILEEDVYRAIEQARTLAIPSSRQIIHTIPREFVVDQQSGIKNPVGMTGSRLEVDAHIISAPVTAIHNLERCIQTIGLKIDSIVFSGWAASQTVLTSTEKELGVLLLDIGAGTTTVSTFEEDAITYSASIPFGGANVTRDLAAGLRMSLDEAEKVKTNIEDIMKKSSSSKRASRKSEDKKEEEEPKKENTGDVLDITDLNIQNVKTISKKLFNLIIDERIKEIFELVLDNVEQSGHEYRLPAGIVITGGSASLPEIAALAKKVFGVPARVATPMGLEGLLDGVSAPTHASVQGLIANAINNESYSTDSSYAPRKGGEAGGGMFGKLTDFIKGFLP
ncbi:MAG: cell division protein FtsA [Candidatus Dojkabacteria bacterium]|nr:cell division protein FtsA [Candidatus Dojkabacteria bacterium]